MRTFIGRHSVTGKWYAFSNEPRCEQWGDTPGDAFVKLAAYLREHFQIQHVPSPLEWDGASEVIAGLPPPHVDYHLRTGMLAAQGLVFEDPDGERVWFAADCAKAAAARQDWKACAVFFELALALLREKKLAQGG